LTDFSIAAFLRINPAFLVEIEEIAENSNLYRTLVKKEAGASEVALTKNILV
jgi:uncharacterized protein YigA (DUF484 family)